MTRYTQRSIGRRFEVKMKEGRIVNIVKKAKVDPAPGHTKEVVNYGGVKMEVFASPGQHINLAKELRRQEKSGKLYK